MINLKEKLTRADPWIRQERIQVFGQADAPFASVRDACVWLKNESDLGRTEKLSEEESRYDEFTNELVFRIQNAQQFQPITRRLELSVIANIIRIRDGSDRVHLFEATTERLNRIVEIGEFLSDFLMCHQGEATRLFLVGIEPEHRARHSVLPGRVLNPLGRSPSRLIVEIDSARLDAEYLLSNASDNNTGLFVLKPMDRALIELIKKRGAPPKPGKSGVSSNVKKYWEELREEWNKNHGLFKEYKDWTSLKKKYNRLMHKSDQRIIL